VSGNGKVARSTNYVRLETRAASSTISTGGWSASSSRIPTTRSVLPPSGIVSPGFQLGTALGSVGGSSQPSVSF
jgi:hypothetical protein